MLQRAMRINVYIRFMIYYVIYKIHANYLNVLCILSSMQQNGYKDQLCTRSLWVCVLNDELIILQTAKQTTHCTSYLFSCLFMIKRQQLSVLLYLPLLKRQRPTASVSQKDGRSITKQNRHDNLPKTELAPPSFSDGGEFNCFFLTR